jgi:hypothetical protein
MSMYDTQKLTSKNGKPDSCTLHPISDQVPLCTGDTNDEETNLGCLDVCGILNGLFHQQRSHRRQRANSRIKRRQFESIDSFKL